MGNALIGLQPVKSGSSTGCLVRDHAANGAPEDLGWGPVMERALLWVRVHLLAAELGKLQLVAEEGARDVDILRADTDHLLAIEQLLGESGRETAKKMAATVHHDLRLERHVP